MFANNQINNKNISRWVLLSHLGAPDDPKGIHFDLLLEDMEFCRTWRLSEIPQVNGPYVQAVSITPHNLNWLDIEKKVLSFNRGVATRVKHGVFFDCLPCIEQIYLNLLLIWDKKTLSMVINEKGCKIIDPKK